MAPDNKYTAVDAGQSFVWAALASPTWWAVTSVDWVRHDSGQYSRTHPVGQKAIIANQVKAFVGDILDKASDERADLLGTGLVLAGDVIEKLKDHSPQVIAQASRQNLL